MNVVVFPQSTMAPFAHQNGLSLSTWTVQPLLYRLCAYSILAAPRVTRHELLTVLPTLIRGAPDKLVCYDIANNKDTQTDFCTGTSVSDALYFLPVGRNYTTISTELAQLLFVTNICKEIVHAITVLHL